MFSPDFMRRGWYKHRVKSQFLFRSPREFFLRPKLLRDRFPEQRRIEPAPEVQRRVLAQEEAGHIVFD